MSKEIISDMKDKNVLIVGTGKSGKAAAQAMVKLGAHVSIQDNKPEDEVDSQLEAYLEDKNINCSGAGRPEDMTSFNLLFPVSNTHLSRPPRDLVWIWGVAF